MKLTCRDKGIIHDVYSHAVMSFSQIHRRHFKNRAVPTVSNRLRLLCRNELLRQTRIGVTHLLGRPDEVGVVYQVPSRGIRALKALYPERAIRDKPHRLNLPSLAHDLILNDALLALRKRFPNTQFTHGRNYKNGSHGRHPDAIMDGANGRVAIELELTAKSDTRYRQIVVQYLTDSGFESVLYITAGSVIGDKVAFQITHQRPLEGLASPATGKFYFAGLSRLLKCPMEVSISNGSKELFH